MIFGTDKAGLRSMYEDGTFNCPATLHPEAVDQEVGMTKKILTHGWDVNVWEVSVQHPQMTQSDTFKTAYHGDAAHADREQCKLDDPNWQDHYFGFNLHPYETIFAKANRDINPILLPKLTDWHLNMNYSSYDYC
jgi:hypothetical protein